MIAENATTKSLPPWLEKTDYILKQRLLPLGLFVQLTGMLWIGSNGGYISQTYIWCLFPGLVSLLIDLYRFGPKACLKGMTTGEKMLGILFLWMQVHPLFAPGGMDIGTVFNRIIKIVLYLYVVRTVVLHMEKPEKLLLVAAGVATAFAAATMIYQFGVLDRPMGVRALGEHGYRIAALGIGEFAGFNNPILAALYYGCFASILCGYLAARPFQWQKSVPAILGVVVLGGFIVFSGSRGPLIALLAMIGVAIFLCQYTWKKYLISAITAVGAITAFLLQTEILAQLDRVLANGFNGRFVNWSMAVDYIILNPLGYGAYADYEGPLWRGVILQHPHNMLLNVSYYWGAPTGLVFIAISIWSLGNAAIQRRKLLMSIAGCCLVFGQVGMITDTYSFLIRPDLQWLMFFFPVALCAATKSTK
ncbi:O-antigen ligase family protein [Parendozoicomonas haliclonae]|nr:O-antigen ligase family protein [Parendozoicomonas haliclonae]